MNAIQQKCRPKHQVLVLKCYPRTTKGAVDIKPNSSELSYLLYYATSRRSKIQKIGAFLEKKTASDVWRLRFGNVQVTLQILAALIEKLHKDVVLIAPYVLNVLDTVLRSEDITMIESSLPTFEAFCDFHDATLLTADQTYLRQYESIVQLYTQLASPSHTPGKGPVSNPVQMRWRNAGLEAIRSISTADALASITGRHIDVIIPRILENLWTDTEDFLEVLHRRLEEGIKGDMEKPLKRRTSIATVDTVGDTNPLAMTGTALDVDKLAEEDIGVLALECLKSIFVIPNRSQIHGATASLLRFLLERVAGGESVVKLDVNRARDSGWAISIFNIISRWAPMQDRYVILVAALDTLLRVPIQDQTLQQQMALTAMMSSLLRSDVNLIGLSVMDVLLGLIKQMRKLYKLRSPGQSDDEANATTGADQAVRQKTQYLLNRLELCIGDLATHVYYADQISDMIAAVIVRLKPSRSSSNSSPSGEKAGTDNGPAASTLELGEGHSQVDNYFSLNAGRTSALKIIKAILTVANPERKLIGNRSLSRNRVPLHAWEGTHWLMRDPDGHVRRAYIEALVTWLDRETTADDEKARDESLPRNRSSVKMNRDMTTSPNSRRAVSSASNRERPTRAAPSQFLALLHLVIYDNALQFVEYENDIVFLHILLTKLAFKLGVNAVRHGLPMVYRLQEEIQELDTPLHKVRIAALCHGYFWSLTEKFDFEASVVGRAIQNEVIRRRSKAFWVEGIQVPLPFMDKIGNPGESRPQPAWDHSVLEREELLPFDDRTSLVECIATSYEDSFRTPPGSPTASPNRGITGPILGSTLGSTTTAPVDMDLPPIFREHMLTDWSRDAAVAMLTSVGKSESLTGSKAGTSLTNRGHLTINTVGINGNGKAGPTSPFGSQYNLRPQSAQAHREKERDGTVKPRKSSMRSTVSPSVSMSSRGAVASVDQLKQVLSGKAPPKTAGLVGMDDDSGDSMVSYDDSPSEISFNPPTQPEQAVSPTSSGPKRSGSLSRRGPLTAHPPLEGPPNLYEEGNESEEQVPPVPPLPNISLLGGKKSPVHSPEVSFQESSFRSGTRSLRSRGGDGTRPRSVRSQEDSIKVMDLQDLLRGIDSRPGEGSLSNVTKPPY
ncbi:protein EFR3 [Thelonectria olida]|uniref:Protein EFR3 n=1 Tax=Thelonectria olida TaxID=1576542 RepID=A0A9P9AP95_9HYPO|nr:protein EFR3 [Thelonectria olida]